MTTENREARVRRVYHDVADSYDQVGPPFYARNGADLVVRTGVRPGQRVLDAGCGRGACLFPAADAVGPAGSVVGIDAVPAMVDRTAAEAARRGASTITVVVGDAARPDFPDASFDVVLSGFVLRLLPDPDAALRAYARLLRPGGRLGLSIYGSTFDGRWEPVHAALATFTGPRPAWVDDLGVRRLTELLTGAGFVEPDVVDEPADILFDDPDQWWRYLWASGYRPMVDGIPADRRDEARRVVCGAAERLREPDGRLRLPQTVRFATATGSPRGGASGHG